MPRMDALLPRNKALPTHAGAVARSEVAVTRHEGIPGWKQCDAAVRGQVSNIGEDCNARTSGPKPHRAVPVAVVAIGNEESPAQPSAKFRSCRWGDHGAVLNSQRWRLGTRSPDRNQSRRTTRNHGNQNEGYQRPTHDMHAFPPQRECTEGTVLLLSNPKPSSSRGHSSGLRPVRFGVITKRFARHGRRYLECSGTHGMTAWILPRFQRRTPDHVCCRWKDRAGELRMIPDDHSSISAARPRRPEGSTISPSEGEPHAHHRNRPWPDR